MAVHVTCSTQHLGESQALIDLVSRCTRQVVVPEGIHCCGFAGDKGFTTPELNGHALRSLKDAVQICEEGVSTSRTCEIGLSHHSGIDYHGLVYLVDRVTRPARTEPQEPCPARIAPRLERGFFMVLHSPATAIPDSNVCAHAAVLPSVGRWGGDRSPSRKPEPPSPPPCPPS